MSWMVDPSCPLGDALEIYRQRISILKKGYEQESYRIARIRQSWLALVPVGEATSVDISRYRDERLQSINVRTGKRLSPATVRLELSLLSNFFDIARIEWGACEANPCANVRKPKPSPGRTRRLLPREERMLLTEAKRRNQLHMHAIIVLAIETGMRQGEILTLRWEHIDLRGRIAHLPETKNGTQRDVPLSLRCRDEIVSLGVQEQGRLFTYTSAGFKSSWRTLILTLKIQDLHFHDLRHEAISRLFELGTMDSIEIAAISGHKSMSMLKRYTHLKAQKLVKKLDPVKGKARQALMDVLLPYPAHIAEVDEITIVNIPDLNVVQYGLDRTTAIAAAERELLRAIMLNIRDGQLVPKPGQHLPSIGSHSKPLEYIHPLGYE